MKRYAAMYGAGLLALGVLDAIGLTQIVGPYVSARVGDIMREETEWLAVLLFYLLYPLATIHFAVGARAPGPAAVQGGLFGLTCYGVYEFTNHAILDNWTWGMVALDLVWGGFVTAATAAACAWAGARVSQRAGPRP